MDTPTATDLHIASFVHATAATLQGPGARFGDCTVFVSALFADAARTMPYRFTRDAFKTWLIRAMHMTDAAGAPLVILACADPVAAMPARVVAASEIVDCGCMFHFVRDRTADPQAYAPRARRH